MRFPIFKDLYFSTQKYFYEKIYKKSFVLLTDKEEQYLNSLLVKPISKILEEKEFFGLTFKTNQYTLDPRPESECLVEKILTLNGKYTLVDLGTGTGALIISILKNKTWDGIGIDISQKALDIAYENSKLHNIDHKIKFILNDKLYNLNIPKKSILVCNFPYLKKKDYNQTLKFDPKISLFNKDNFVKHIWKKRNLFDYIFCEFHYKDYIKFKNKYSQLKFFSDYSGTIRFFLYENINKTNKS